MLEVDIDKILPVTEARDNFNKIVDEVEGTDHMYVLTKNGKPSAVVVGVNHLEKLTGKTADELTSIVEKKADETPVVEEVKSGIPANSVGAMPNSQGAVDAGGSKPLATGGIPVAGQSTQNDGSGQLNTPAPSAIEGPIDVPINAEAPLPPPEPAPAPTSSPGSVDGIPAASVGTPMPSVASNQAPDSAPTENGAPSSDSDLFV